MRTNFDILGYLSSKTIPHTLEGKNVSGGWVGIKCRFCGDKSNHLGVNLNSGSFSCFKCGETGTILKLIAAIEPAGWSIVKQVLAEFSSKEFKTHKRPDIEREATFCPPSVDPLSDQAKRYLRNERKFAYKRITNKYGLGYFKPTSIYRFRLYIPVFFNGRLVTFTTRTINEKLEPKYLHCPKRTSSLFAKETLYNIDSAGDTAIVVEGPIDAWRIGDGAVATFGVVFTQRQIKLIRERFKRVFIMYDAEPMAQQQAQRLADSISGFNLEVNVVKLDKGDPGSLSMAEARHIRQEIIGR